jgi:hypothetical protein
MWIVKYFSRTGGQSFWFWKIIKKEKRQQLIYIYTELQEIVLQNCINDLPYDWNICEANILIFILTTISQVDEHILLFIILSIWYL